MRTQIVFGTFAALAVLAALPVTAAPAPAAPAAAARTGDTPDPARQREFGARLLVCTTCHGTDGVPKAAAIPIISGQHENYLAKQLHDFGSGTRKAEIMEWMTKTLNEDEREPTATFFAKKSWPARSAQAAAPAAPRGSRLPGLSCAELPWRPAGRRGMTTPRLASQTYEYLVESMRRFADGGGPMPIWYR
jgi:cytochrome c553